jgi:hypothetical protein
MRCEEVRPLLPELAEGALRPAGEVERHIASCALCSGELERFRTVVVELAALRAVVIEPPEGFLGRVLAGIPERQWRANLVRAVSDPRLQNAAFSIGGAVVGAAAIGLLWWRVAHRALAPRAPAPTASETA